MLSNLKNIFKVTDLRNKILFTVLIILIYRFGIAIRVPGVDSLAVKQFEDQASSQGAIGFLNLFSGGGFKSFSIFALGIMPYITASIIMQILGVVIPKLEELQQEGAVGQRKITQYTRYVTIALATLQAAGLVFVFGSGRGASYLSVRRAVGRQAAARRAVAARLPDHPHPRRRHRPADVDGRADQPARHRQRHVDDDLRLGRVRHAVRLLLDHPAEQVDLVLPGGGPDDRHHRVRRVRRARATANSGAVRQTCGRPADVRRPEHLHPAEGQPVGRHPDDLRQLDPAAPGDHGRTSSAPARPPRGSARRSPPGSTSTSSTRRTSSTSRCSRC